MKNNLNILHGQVFVMMLYSLSTLDEQCMLTRTAESAWSFKSEAKKSRRTLSQY